MAGIAIVAIPEEDDPVWKISSEKIPHLTLLYMEGPLENEENTIRFIEHVVSTSMRRFGMSVDRRGVLGEDEADVVFLDKRHGGRELLQARGFMLANDDISTAYKKATQYPIFTPHVTLGYPSAPAREGEKLYWINFDKVAIWTSEYSGPEFKLEEDRGMEIDIPAAWSEDHFGDRLMHFGVRGMKWGVRRMGKQAGMQAAMTYAKNRDAKWLAKVEANPKLGKISAKAARQSRKLTRQLKKDYKANGLDIRRNKLAQARYDAELKAILETSLDRAAYKVHKNSPSRLSEVAIHRHPDGSISAIVQPRHNRKIVKQKGKIAKLDAKIEKRSRDEQAREERREAELELQQAAPDDLEDGDGLYDDLVFSLTVDDEGFVNEITVPNGDLYQSELDDEDALEHGLGDLVKKVTGGAKKVGGGVDKFKRDAQGQFAKVADSATVAAIEEAMKEAGLFVGKTGDEIATMVGAAVSSMTKTTTIERSGGTTVSYGGKTYQVEETADGKIVVKKPVSKSKPNFNPNSKLDSSQVEKSSKAGKIDVFLNKLEGTKRRNMPGKKGKDLSELAREAAAKKKRAKHDALEFDSPEDVLAHFGVRGMKWGVRRPTDSSGLVIGKAPGAKSTAKKDDDELSPVKIKRGKGSADHQRMEKNLGKKVENLSTADIKALTARIKAVNDLKTQTAAQKAAKASMGKKLAKWALNAVATGAREKAESIIKEHAGDMLLEAVPKSKSQKKRERDDAQKQEDRDSRIRKEKQADADRAAKQQKDSEPKNREEAVRDLTNAIVNSEGVYQITSKKKGG